MNEQELGKEIAKFLDISANENIKQSTLYRLQSARRAALENYQPTLEIINSGHNTSIYGGHSEHFNAGKLLLLLIALFAFALVSATYWQFLEKGKSAVDTTILIDDLSTETFFDNESDLVDDLLKETFFDNEPDVADTISTDVRIDNESELANRITTESRIDNEPAISSGKSTDAHIDHESKLDDDMPTDTRIDNELDEWFDSNK